MERLKEIADNATLTELLRRQRLIRDHVVPSQLFQHPHFLLTIRIYLNALGASRVKLYRIYVPRDEASRC